MGWDLTQFDLANIANRFYEEISLIEVCEASIEFASKNAFVSKIAQRKMKPSEAGEQVDES